MSKLLKIENGRGYFLLENGAYAVITEISVERLKQILELVFNEQNSQFDTYDENSVHNAADKIIYSRIYTKLKNIEVNRDEIVNRISSEFSSLKSKYMID